MSLFSHLRWEEVGDGIHNGVGLFALPAEERAGNYLLVLFLFNRKLQLPLAHRTG